ncbi:MAG: leucine-rich repeat domain-containing protein [Eubacteriales bacterium]|nr:leucine-rich repeat domain-containing protein [Eubacteriales bacterium]
MENRKCPVCGKEQDELYFCRQCGWDFTTDFLTAEWQPEMSEKERELYCERLELLKKNFEKVRKWEQIRRIADASGTKKGEFDPKKCGIDTESSSVEIPEGYEKIGEEAFRGWKNLKEIRMPKTIREIGARAFYECENLCVIGWSLDLKRIRKEAFFKCKSLRELKLPPHTEEIGTRAFEGCENIKKVFFPDSLKIIWKEAWAGCEALEEICLPEGLQILGAGTFSGCHKIQLISIPESLAERWNEKQCFAEIFQWCENIRQVRIPDTGNFELLTQVLNFSSLISVSFFHRAQGIRKRKFEWSIEQKNTTIAEIDCDTHKWTLRIPYGYTQLGMIRNVERIWIPDSVEKIEERLGDVGDLSSGRYEIPIKWSQNLRVIGKQCCSRLGIQKLDLPPNIENIGVGAFEHCDFLEWVFLPNTIKKIGADAFYGCPIKVFVLEKGIRETIEWQMRRKFPTAQFQITERGRKNDLPCHSRI